MEYFPFDSEVTYDTSGNPIYDRSANSSDLSMIFSEFYSNGLVPEITDNFKVSISSGMTVSVSAGAGFIEGKVCKETSATSITIDAADTTYSRIDTVVLRLNTNREYRNIALRLLKGTASASPVATALTRAGGIYELSLAEIKVGANVSQITASAINDTRLDRTKCGYITPIAGAVDTSDFTSQIQAMITDLQNEINSIEQGSAVMLKATYDTNDSGRVDNADYDNTASGLTATDTKSAIDELANMIYPVGSIYLSVNNVNPSTIFGGTWQQIKDRFLLGAGSTYTAGGTGGEATHLLTEQEMPSHSHTSKGYIRISDTGGTQNGLISTGQAATERTNPTGGSQAHNNMPPYLTVYMWKRTA